LTVFGKVYAVADFSVTAFNLLRGTMRTFLLVCAALSLACSESDNGPTAPPDPMEAIRGSWTLQSWELRDVANPEQKLDMSAAGFAGTLVVEPSGAFTISLTFQGAPTSTQTGTLSVRGDTLVFNSEDGEFLIKYSSAGGTMIWDTILPETADMDGDRVPENFTEHMVFRRN
jgi:hypothetical protein